MASYGHVRDLPRKGLGVDREHSYEPTYEVLAGKEKTINELKRAAKTADAVYLAADPDREGEAISWHLRETLKPGAGKTTVPAGALQRDHQEGRARGHGERGRDRRRSASTPSRPGASSTGSSDTRCRTCSGRRSGGASPPAASRRWRCGSSASARARSKRSSRSSTGRSTRSSRARCRPSSRRASPPSTARSSSSTARTRVSPDEASATRVVDDVSKADWTSRPSRPPSGARTRRRRSSPRSSSRPRPAASASPCGGPCRSRSDSMRAARSRGGAPSD